MDHVKKTHSDPQQATVERMTQMAAQRTLKIYKTNTVISEFKFFASPMQFKTLFNRSYKKTHSDQHLETAARKTRMTTAAATTAARKTLTALRTQMAARKTLMAQRTQMARKTLMARRTQMAAMKTLKV